MTGYRLLVEKSTVPAKTSEHLKRTVLKYLREDTDFDVASNPEFLREGTAIEDATHPDRIVVGVESQRAGDLLEEIYRPILEKGGGEFLRMSVTSAELTKHASNSFLAMKISYINAVARLCELAGADVGQVAKGMGLDPRIGPRFLSAGVGYGGSCFPKDVSAFLHISDKLGARFELLADVLRINETQARYFVEKIKNALKSLKGKTIGVLGLAFKPDTDDMRCAPSVPIIQMLQKEGARIRAYDPQAAAKASELLADVTYAANPYETGHGAHAIAVLTEWSEFLNLDWDNLKKHMKDRFFFDGRNMFQPAEMKKQGFRYFSIGRPSA